MVGPFRLTSCVALAFILIIGMPFSARAESFPKETFSLDEISFCDLLTNEEVESATNRQVIKIISSPQSCEWKLNPVNNSDNSDDEIRVIARAEYELPSTMHGLEGLIGLKGPWLSKMPGAADLKLTEVDPNVKGVHTDCGFYLFSLEMRLPNIDYQKVGRKLGVAALWRFNGSGRNIRCFAEKLIPEQYPDFSFPLQPPS